MKKSTSGYKLKGSVFALMAMMPFLASCGDPADGDKGKDPEQTETKPDRMRYLPYSIRFDLKGNPVIVDEKGKPVPAEQADLPVQATSIANVQSISVVTYTGSCKQVYSIGGKLYTITLPDSVCASL